MAAIIAEEQHPRSPSILYPGWLAVPPGLRTVAQWRRDGRTVRAPFKKTPAGVVDWDGLAVKLYAEEQTCPYNPKPETVAFREDCQAFTAFLNPRRDRYAFKPRRDWECRDWPQAKDHLTDDILERAFSSAARPRKPTPAGSKKVDYRGCFIEIQHSFWGLKELPPNGSLNAVLGPHLRLCLAFDHSPEEVVEFYRRELPDRPDVSFSRRLSEDPGKIFRDELATARRIEHGNGYQPDPEGSTLIFRRLAESFRRQGLDPLDPMAFGRYRRSAQADLTGHEAKLGYDARLKVKEHAGWLHHDVAVVYAAARRVLGFVEANPGRQMAAVLVPVLCEGMPIAWHCDSDGQGRRCKKAERFLRSLVAAGVLEMSRPPLFLGPLNPDNRATEYVPGEAMQPKAASEQEGGRPTTLADKTSLPRRWYAGLERELARLRRLRPGLRGPPPAREAA